MLSLSKYLSTISDNTAIEPLTISSDIQVTSLETYNMDTLIETCNRYIISVEQGETPIEEFSFDVIRDAYNDLIIPDEKESLRYRIEALQTLQTLDERLTNEPKWSWNKWYRVDQEVKHLVSSRLQKQYLWHLEAIEPEKSSEDKQPTMDEQLMDVLGDEYANLPRPLRYWLKDEVISETEDLETVALNRFHQLNSEWQEVKETSTQKEWLEAIQNTVLYQEAQVGLLTDWEAAYDSASSFERWDQILMAVKKQVKHREREEEKEMEGNGVSSTLYESSISKVTET